MTWLGNLEMMKLQPLPWPDLQERFEILRLDLAPSNVVTLQTLEQWPDADIRRMAEELFELFLSVSGRCRSA